MKNLFYLTFFTVLTINAQNGLVKLKSVSAGFGLFESNSETLTDGATLNTDISISLKNNLFTLQYKYGFEAPSLSIVRVEDPTFYDSYHEINITYGRELKIKKWMAIEGQAGLGYLNFIGEGNGFEFEKSTTNALGFPIRLKLLFYIKNFGIGLNPNANLNAINNMYSGNLIFQYRFN